MKVAVGISGGVDSAVAALLLKEQGHEVVGVTMTLGRTPIVNGRGRPLSQDDEEKSLAEARVAAERLDIPLRVFDFADEWRKQVLDYIRTTYRDGRTPNPCVRCNERVKFGLLPRAAFERLGCDRFATGHYARLVDGRLFRAVDRSKDQSYFLYRVAPEILARTLFPLGELTKAEVRARAREFALAVADKGDSQDFCGGDVGAIIDLAAREGEIVRTDGKVLGHHAGFWNYTIGKRKGLGVGGGTPYYVVRLDAARNQVIVGTRDETICHELRLTDTVGRIDLSLPVKVRSAGEPKRLADGLSGVAPGQSAVFYDGDEVVGGGIIV